MYVGIAATMTLFLTAVRFVRKFLVIGILILVFVALLMPLLRNRGKPTVPTPIGPRAIIGSTLPMKEQWRKNGIFLPFHYIPSGVLASGEYVVFVNYSMGGFNRKLQVLDAETGVLLWEVPDMPFEQSLLMDQERLFIAVNWEIRAYNLSNGELLWHSEHLPEHTSYWLNTSNGDLIVYSTESAFNTRKQVLRTYEVQSGILTDIVRIEVPPNVRLVLRSPFIDFWSDGDRFWATDRASGMTRWQVQIDDSPETWPILTDSLVLFSWGVFPRLIAVDRLTGNLQREWEYERGLVSNFVMSQNVVYAIRSDGVLVGISPRTGKEEGHIKFAPSQTESNVRTIAYWVAASEDKVFAYFGDSQELIAFSSTGR